MTKIDDLAVLDGLITTDEGAFLASLAADVPADECIVEIGSFKGQSACYLARGAKSGNGAKVHCVDLWDLGGQRYAESAGYADPTTWEAFQAQIATARVKSAVTAHKGRSTEVAAAWNGPPVGLLFLDGDHRYEATKADLEAWLPHLAPGGAVAFHDYVERFPGVIQVADEWITELFDAGTPAEWEQFETIRVVRP